MNNKYCKKSLFWVSKYVDVNEQCLTTCNYGNYNVLRSPREETVLNYGNYNVEMMF
jgi:hypothetical protein